MEHELDSTQLPLQSLTQRPVSKHESDSKTNNTTRDSPSKNDIGPQVMVIRTNSIQDTNPSSIAKSSILSLTEHYFLNRAIEQLNGPKYETCGSKEARLRSFIIHDWPRLRTCT